MKFTDWLDSIIKIITTVLAVLGLYISVNQFQIQQDINEEHDFKRGIWEKRLEAYMEIGALTAQLSANTANTKKFNSLKEKFEQLYWGKLPLFEDPEVEMRMKLYDDELDSFKKGEGDLFILKKRGYELVHSCKVSLDSSWRKIER